MQRKGELIDVRPILLSKMKRMCGPEEDMLFHESVADWEQRVAAILESIKNGWVVPPLLLWWRTDYLYCGWSGSI